jgi:predicted ATPase/DNA-binding CsgD family transcriptional regulator
VLDNFEQLLPATPLLIDLLRAHEHLTILVTSRSVLTVYGEHAYPVPPLAVPDLPPGRASRQTLATLAEAHAIQLFVSRARAVVPDFALDAANAAAVVRICRQIDGLPLAIELAAARLAMFTPQALADRLERSLGVLGSRPDAGGARLRTMHETIAWSIDLLTPDERAILFRLAVFLGEWTFEDAEALTALALPGSGPFDEVTTLDAIGSLVSKSLVQQVSHDGGVTTFRMLQTLREFAIDHLAGSGEAMALLEAKDRWLLRVAEEAAPHLTSRDQMVWLDRLERLRSDFRTTFARLMTQHPTNDALRLANALWEFGYIRSLIRETRIAIEEALEHADAPPALTGSALNGAGFLANMESNVALARRHHERARVLGEASGEDLILADALLGLGGAEVSDRRYEEAQISYREASAVYERIGNQRGLALANTNLGNVYQVLGQLQEARTAHELALRKYTEMGDRRGVAWSLTNVGHVVTQQGDFEGAAQVLLRGFLGYIELGDQAGCAEAYEAFALIAARAGLAAVSAELIGGAAAVRERIHHPVQAQEQPRYDQAVALGRRAIGNDAWERHHAIGAAREDAAMEAFAIETVQEWLRTGIREAAIAPVLAGIDAFGLTTREVDVLELIVNGKSDREIAEALGISARTVGSHVSNVYRKLGVQSRAAAVATVFRGHR